MQAHEVSYFLPNGNNNHAAYYDVIRALEESNYQVKIHDRNGHWPDTIQAADGQRAGRIVSPFCLVVELTQAAGADLSKFMENYQPPTESPTR